MSTTLARCAVRIVLVAAFCCSCASRALAQQDPRYILDGTASLWWEGSWDGGQTWHRNVMEVEPGARSVQVRFGCQWSLPVPGFFGGAYLDPFVSGAHATDSMGGISFVPLTGGAFDILHRLGDILKFDLPEDTALPGQGPYWTVVSNRWPEFPAVLDNPVQLMTYRVDLSGEPGDRVVNAAFATSSEWGPERRVQIFSEIRALDHYVPLTTHEPLTIRVVPAPAPLALLGVSLALARRRRR